MEYLDLAIGYSFSFYTGFSIRDAIFPIPDPARLFKDTEKTEKSGFDFYYLMGKLRGLIICSQFHQASQF